MKGLEKNLKITKIIILLKILLPMEKNQKKKKKIVTTDISPSGIQFVLVNSFAIK